MTLSSSYICLVNCSVFNGSLDSDFESDTTVIIQDGIIHEIGASVPAGAQVIDMNGKYLMPGLINAHCHLFSNGKPSTVGRSESLLNMYVSAIGCWPGRTLFKRKISRNIYNALHAGITTLRCLGDPHFYDVKIRDSLKYSPGLAPRIIAAGMGICITGGHANSISLKADSPWECRKAVRQNVREGVDQIKILSTGGASDSRRVGEAGRLQMTPKEIFAACDEAHRAQLLVASHCLSSDGVLESLRGGADTIEHGATLNDEMVALFKQNPNSLRGWSALIPTLSPVFHLCGVNRETAMISQAMADNVALIREGMVSATKVALNTGIRIGIGSDAAMPMVTHYDFWRELLYLCSCTGISAKHAIHLATTGNAEILGISHQTGRIAAGLSADLIGFDNNPFENINILANPRFVMMQGHQLHKPRVNRFERVETCLNQINVNGEWNKPGL